jgi:hypothetical protein
MKRALVILSLLTISMVLVFTSCKKEAEKENKTKNPQTTEIYLKSLEPDIIIKGSGNKDDYKKNVVEELVKKEECKWEVVSGIIEYYYQDEMVFSIDFGNGNCDGLATVSWLENGMIESKDVDVWALFKQKKEDYVIVQKLVKNENCDYEIVSGIIEYQDKEGNPYVTIDFGDGNCDGIASKCWTKDGVVECKDFDVHYWDGKY